MADNVAINQGVGTSIATDQVGSDHYQKIKLVDGTADSSTAISGTSTKGLFVDPHQSWIRSQQTPTINTSAYTSGDELGTLMTITNAVRVSGGAGMVRAITVLDKTQAQRAAIDVLFFDSSISVAGNNNPFLPSDADMLKFLGLVAVATGDYNTAWAGTPTNSAATKILATPLPFVCSGSTSLFALAVVRGTPTYTSTSDIVISFLIEQA